MAYYEKEALLDFVKKYTPHFDGETTMQCVERAIENAPTADVEEVRHGRWKTIDTSLGRCCVCSECGGLPTKKYNYCPYCGTKMNKKGGEYIRERRERETRIARRRIRISFESITSCRARRT